MSPTIVLRKQPHGVYYALDKRFNAGNGVGGNVLAVRVCPLQAMHMAYHALVVWYSKSVRRGKRYPVRFMDRPTYRYPQARDDRRYLWDDDAFFHWHESDHAPRTNRRRA